MCRLLDLAELSYAFDSLLQLAKNVALCIGKIARLDYGMDW